MRGFVVIMEVLSKFAEILDELMFDEGINGQALAEKIGISKQQVYYVLNHKRQPSLDMLLRIADHFSCTSDFLLGREPENSAKSFRPVPPFPQQLAFLLEYFHTNKYRLCKQIPITHSVIYNWQRGVYAPSLDYIIKLADHFDCSVDFVIGREK